MLIQLKTNSYIDYNRLNFQFIKIKLINIYNLFENHLFLFYIVVHNKKPPSADFCRVDPYL